MVYRKESKKRVASDRSEQTLNQEPLGIFSKHWTVPARLTSFRRKHPNPTPNMPPQARTDTTTFGLNQSPLILVFLQITVLAPNQRPQQQTQDMKSSVTTYPEPRKELEADIPNMPTEHPTAADAQNRPQRKNRQMGSNYSRTLQPLEVLSASRIKNQFENQLERPSSTAPRLVLASLNGFELRGFTPLLSSSMRVLGSGWVWVNFRIPLRES